MGLWVKGVDWAVNVLNGLYLKPFYITFRT